MDILVRCRCLFTYILRRSSLENIEYALCIKYLAYVERWQLDAWPPPGFAMTSVVVDGEERVVAKWCVSGDWIGVPVYYVP